MFEFIFSDAISLFLTLLSLVLAIVFYYRSLNLKSPCYERTNKLLIDSLLVEKNLIKIMFQDKLVNTVSLTHIAFWNDGRATISKSDIIKSDPLRIVAMNGNKILAAEVLTTNREVTHFQAILKPRENQVIIDFDFLDYKNGGIIQIYHTGKNLSDIDVLGSIKGTNGITNVDKASVFLLEKLEKFRVNFIDRIARYIPKWLRKGQEYIETRGVLWQITIGLPINLMIMLFMLPFVLVYIVIGSILLAATFIVVMINISRFNIPKEFYSIMR